MSGFDKNNHQHRHPKTSSSLTINYYYCLNHYHCCRWWYLLLGLLVLRISISSLLQSATAYFITKCDGLLLQSATAFLLKIVLLQSATGITKCDRTKRFLHLTPTWNHIKVAFLTGFFRAVERKIDVDIEDFTLRWKYWRGNFEAKFWTGLLG